MSALSAIARHEFYLELGNAMPRPINQTQENHQRRHITTIETFDALRPGDAYEASLAVRIVLTGAHAVECLRLAAHHHEDFAKTMRCHARAASFMREERAAKRMLAQEQKVRLAVEAVASNAPAQPLASATPARPVASAAPAQPVAGRAPAQPAATSAAPPQSAHRAAPPVRAAAPAPQPASKSAAPLRPDAAHAAPAQSAADASVRPPSLKAIAQAEAFLQENPGAAAQIHHDRGVTPQIKAHYHYLTLPTDPAVIDALVRGKSDLLAILDEIESENLDEAA